MGLAGCGMQMLTHRRVEGTQGTQGTQGNKGTKGAGCRVELDRFVVGFAILIGLLQRLYP
jgi:hypothetical protein